MRRRRLLTTLGAVGTAAVAGCGAVSGDETLSDPTVVEDAPGRRTLVFAVDGDEVGHFGVDGRVADGTVRMDTELWHRSNTRVRSVRLHLWANPEHAATRIGLDAPLQGDSSAPPDVTLSTPDRGRGVLVTVDDLDDLADETISTIDLFVDPGADAATTVTVDCEIDLTGTGTFGTDYTLRGRMGLEYPELGGDS